MKTIIHPLGISCYLQIDHYVTGKRLALRLVTSQDGEDSYAGEPFSTVTANLPAVSLADDEVIVKNYSENEGLDTLLMHLGIAHYTGRTISSGFVAMPIMKLDLAELAKYTMPDNPTMLDNQK
jgi:hypothetical protein